MKFRKSLKYLYFTLLLETNLMHMAFWDMALIGFLRIMVQTGDEIGDPSQFSIKI